MVGMEPEPGVKFGRPRCEPCLLNPKFLYLIEDGSNVARAGGSRGCCFWKFVYDLPGAFELGRALSSTAMSSRSGPSGASVWLCMRRVRFYFFLFSGDCVYSFFLSGAERKSRWWWWCCGWCRESEWVAAAGVGGKLKAGLLSDGSPRIRHQKAKAPWTELKPCSAWDGNLD